MKDESGSIRTDIQGQGGSEVAAAAERITGGGGARSWRWCGNSGALARGCAVQATRADRKRIKELERDLLRKDRALAETAALLVLSKKVAAIFNRGEDE
jgi:hypothetical protein